MHKRPKGKEKRAPKNTYTFKIYTLVHTHTYIFLYRPTNGKETPKPKGERWEVDSHSPPDRNAEKEVA